MAATCCTLALLLVPAAVVAQELVMDSSEPPLLFSDSSEPDMILAFEEPLADPPRPFAGPYADPEDLTAVDEDKDAPAFVDDEYHEDEADPPQQVRGITLGGYPASLAESRPEVGNLRGAPGVVSSSSSSQKTSTQLVEGKDGKLHKVETKVVEETSNDGTHKSTVICVDGRCRGTTDDVPAKGLSIGGMGGVPAVGGSRGLRRSMEAAAAAAAAALSKAGVGEVPPKKQKDKEDIAARDDDDQDEESTGKDGALTNATPTDLEQKLREALAGARQLNSSEQVLNSSSSESGSTFSRATSSVSDGSGTVVETTECVNGVCKQTSHQYGNRDKNPGEDEEIQAVRGLPAPRIRIRIPEKTKKPKRARRATAEEATSEAGKEAAEERANEAAEEVAAEMVNAVKSAMEKEQKESTPSPLGMEILAELPDADAEA